MTAEIVVPKIGLTVESVEVITWLKEIGDAVAEGDTLVELAADKADVEVTAPEAGRLTEVLVFAGDTAVLGQVLGRIETVVDQLSQPLTTPPRTTAASGATAELLREPEPFIPSDDRVSRGRAAVTSDGRRIRISPVARRAAAAKGIAPASLVGTGPRGRIVLRDVRAFTTERSEAALQPVGHGGTVQGRTPPPRIAQVAGPAAPSAETELEEVRFSAARRATARLMALSRDTVAPVTLHARAPAEQAARAVRQLKAEGLPATFSHAVIVACVRALARHPAVNAIWEGDRLLRSRPVHLGVAVDDDGDLLSAVVADAGERDVIATILGTVEAVARARAREAVAVTATFTISNLGMFGVEQFTPIIAPPQVAVLGVGAIVDGRCHLSLTFDHRAVDGAPAARFLAEVGHQLSAFDGR